MVRWLRLGWWGEQEGGSFWRGEWLGEGVVILGRIGGWWWKGQVG